MIRLDAQIFLRRVTLLREGFRTTIGPSPSALDSVTGSRLTTTGVSVTTSVVCSTISFRAGGFLAFFLLRFFDFGMVPPDFMLRYVTAQD